MCTFFFVHPKKAKGAPFTFRFPSCLSLSFLDPPPKIPGLINNDRLVYKNSSGSLLGKKAGRQKISIPSDPLKARNCCNKQKPGTKLWAQRRTFFTSHFFDLCSAGRLPNSINSSIQVNLSVFFYILYGSVALLSHFAKCKNQKCKNKKCEIFLLHFSMI